MEEVTAVVLEHGQLVKDASGPEGAVHVPELLLVAAGSKDSGKTSLVERVLRKFASLGVAAVKVTTVDSGFSGSSKGDYHRFEGAFSLSDETGTAALASDTGRMVAAGASRVWWLRVRGGQLQPALAHLMQHLEPGQLLVAESNQLRLCANPSVFFMLSGGIPESQWKESARTTVRWADRVLDLRPPGSLDSVLADISVHNGGWCLAQPVTGIVLAGGKSRRMGVDKGLLEVKGEPLVVHAARMLEPWTRQVVISARDGERYRFAGLPIVSDERPGEGPLAALVSAMAVAQETCCLSLPCDVPVLPFGLLQSLLRQIRFGDAAVPAYDNGMREPLVASFGPTFYRAAKEMVARGERTILNVYPEIATRYLMLQRPLVNLNTRAELVRFQAGEVGDDRG